MTTKAEDFDAAVKWARLRLQSAHEGRELARGLPPSRLLQASGSPQTTKAINELKRELETKLERGLSLTEQEANWYHAPRKRPRKRPPVNMLDTRNREIARVTLLIPRMFALHLRRNYSTDRRLSACDAVARANHLNGLKPASYDGIAKLCTSAVLEANEHVRDIAAELLPTAREMGLEISRIDIEELLWQFGTLGQAGDLSRLQKPHAMEILRIFAGAHRNN
ncbi:MAG: hypothetical protein ACQEUZ_03790 [Pseudomonadota bacterium]